MRIILSDNAQLIKTFIIIDGKVYTGKHQMHANLYDAIVDRGGADEFTPYYYYPRGALYNEDEKAIIVGPSEFNPSQQDKIARVFKVKDSDYKYGDSPHYSEHQVKEFSTYENPSSVQSAINFFKKQLNKF